MMAHQYTNFTVRRLFQINRNYSQKISKLCNFVFEQEKKKNNKKKKIATITLYRAIYCKITSYFYIFLVLTLVL